MESTTILSLAQLFMSFGTTLLVLYLTYSMCTFIARRWLKMEQAVHAHRSASMLSAAVLFSVGILSVRVMEPVSEIIRILSKAEEDMLMLALKTLGYNLGFLGMAFVVAMLVIIASFVLFSLMTQSVSEREEIKNDNWFLSLILAVMIIVMTLVVKDEVVLLMESLVPYPELPRLF